MDMVDFALQRLLGLGQNPMQGFGIDPETGQPRQRMNPPEAPPPPLQFNPTVPLDASQVVDLRGQPGASVPGWWTEQAQQRAATLGLPDWAGPLIEQWPGAQWWAERQRQHPVRQRGQ